MQKYLRAYAPSLGELWFIMLVLVCLGGGMAGGIVAALANFIFSLDSDTLVTISIAVYPLTFVFAIPFVFYRAKENYRRHKIIPSSVTTFGRMPLLLLILVLFFLVLAFATSIEPLTMWIPMPDFIKKIFESLTSNGWVSFLSVVVMAPLLEEWLCRKVALGGLLNSGYSPAVAICWSALMFGIIHMNPWQTIPAFLMGVLFGWIYWRTRSVWLVIFMHAVNNGVAFLLATLFPDISEDVGMLDLVGPQNYPLVLSGAIVLVVLIVWLLHKQLAPASSLFKREEQQPAAL
ncbi:MAG: CPBP family intramembrane metalloprotease [Bacteroidales bacterium]|nr:CPBP family intramembrane metalloprotease [Bacteroidales bacterium]